MKKKKENPIVKKWSDRIAEAIAVNGPYSHNIISLALQAVDKEVGTKEANKLITKFKLDRMGWQKVEEK
jgi:hypothetical protein